MKLELASIYSVFAPIATPLAPAAMLARQAFLDMTSAGYGGDWMMVSIATVVAIAFAAGTEASGYLAMKSALKAWQYNQRQAMGLAILCTAIYAAFVIAGVYQIGGAMVLAVLISIIANLGAAIYGFLRSVEEKEERARADKLKAERDAKQVRELEIKAEQAKLELAARTAESERNAEAKRLEAAAKLAKMENAGRRLELKLTAPTGNLPEQPESYRKVTADWRKLSAAERKEIETMETAAIMERYQVSDRTARNWKTNAQKE